jgi:hypothetical protein
VLFSTDLSRESLAATPYVLTAVREWRTELDSVHICSGAHPGHCSQMDNLSGKIRESLDGKEYVSFRSQLLTGKPAACVIDFARRNREDLIVLGLSPHHALHNGSLWSQAYEIVRHAPCPVLSVRAGSPNTISDGCDSGVGRSKEH